MRFAAAVSSSKLDEDDNLVPLINVVFLMLIFFMVAGQISQQDGELLDPIQSATEASLDEAPLQLVITKNGRILLNNMLLKVEQLPQSIRQAREARPVYQALESEALEMQVKVDAAYPVGELRQILRAVHASGISKLVLVTQQVQPT
ncbi:biopolymer transporter ExbD [Candidatus Saccharibacteria bacterium]|jgi:biopolymer transport protein ExbD|nr:biopolymer transporter ExbD [Candidatus Saccharibacteria bacterium]MCP5208179.1 biopolymer transporter ExbD [Hahellaceae bacterium]MCP5209703.1 biopolymer transporter ExbD [Hahellaceae bacterium]